MIARGRYLVGVVGLSLLALLIWYFGVGEIFEQLKEISPSWALLAAMCILGVGVLGAINIYLFVSRDDALTLVEFMPLYWTSWAIGLVVPGQIGDVASMGFLLRRRAFSLAKVLGRAVLDKAISFAVMLGFVIVGLAVFVKDVILIRRSLLGLVILFVLGVIAIYLMKDRWRRLFDPQKPGMRGALARMLAELEQTVRHAPARVLLNIGLTIAKVMVTGAAYWAMFYAMGETNLSLLKIAVLATMAGLIAYLPISLNGLGTVEAAGIFLFGQAGIAATTVLSAYIGLRILVLAMAWVPTLVWWVYVERNARSLT
jgi:uncharacterized protein (TIRG00374 family)